MIEGFPYRAIILDLDGVITDTRQLHLNAWRETFNTITKPPLSDSEYNDFIDGQPRENGIRNFLAHRRLHLNQPQIEALSQLKDQSYRQALHQEGPTVYKDALLMLKQWQQAGLPLAIVSSSKNCLEVLRVAGLEKYFSVRVDGIIGEQRHLNGKPEADYFLEAAREMNIPPHEIAIVEDSISGVQAGKRGKFKGVIGMSRQGQTPPEKLYQGGANMVVSSLTEIVSRKNALKAWREIQRRINQKELAIFLDFDGTLSDIVPRPEDAKLRNGLKETLQCLSSSIKTSIISGRDRSDVKKRVDVADVFYAGCHGFDISGPGGFHYQVDEAMHILPQLYQARDEVKSKLDGIEGVSFEEKKFFFAIHYRNVSENREEKVLQIVQDVASRWPTLKIREGKKVIEFGPNLDWGKGHAIRKLEEVLEINQTSYIPLYIGDDLTDEDAFREIRGMGITIKVQDGPGIPTLADYWLADGKEVDHFIQLIVNDYTREEKVWRPGA